MGRSEADAYRVGSPVVADPHVSQYEADQIFAIWQRKLGLCVIHGSARRRGDFSRWVYRRHPAGEPSHHLWPCLSEELRHRSSHLAVVGELPDLRRRKMVEYALSHRSRSDDVHLGAQHLWLRRQSRKNGFDLYNRRITNVQDDLGFRFIARNDVPYHNLRDA